MTDQLKTKTILKLTGCLLTTVLWAGFAVGEEADKADSSTIPRATAGTARAALFNNLEVMLEERLPEESLWLGGDGQSRFLSLNKPSTIPNNKGNLLLIVNAGHQVVHSVRTLEMRDSFADHGWNTLIISLPAFPAKPIPQRKPQSEDSSSPATNFQELLKTWQLDCKTRIEAGLAQLGKTDNTDTTVIAEGQSAGLVLHLLANGSFTQKVANLALINLNLGNSAALQSISTPSSQTGKLKFAVLEVNADPWRLRHRKGLRRNNKTGASQFSHYQVLQLPPSSPAGLHGENMMTRRIRGWLKSLAS